MASKCGICNDPIPDDDSGFLLKAGVDSIKLISKDLKDGIGDQLQSMTVPIAIHVSCRRKYTKPSTIRAKKRNRSANHDAENDDPISRSQLKKYNPYTDCCLCNTEIPYFKNCSKEHPENYDNKIPVERREHCAETNELIATIMTKASERNDEWGREVTYRLTPYKDLVALEAKLHGNCQVRDGSEFTGWGSEVCTFRRLK